MTPQEKEIAGLKAHIATLELRKPRADGTAVLQIDTALRALNDLEAGTDDDRDSDRFALIRRVLTAERDIYQPPAETE